MTDPPNPNEYAELMSQWFDELAPLVDAFKKQFPPQTVGFVKYLFAIHMMQSAVCADLELPQERFVDFISGLTSAWFAAGQPLMFRIAKSGVIAEDSTGRPN